MILTLTRNSSFMADNCNRQSPARKRFNGLPIPVGKGKHTMIPSMWHACGPGHLRHYRPAIALPRAANAASPSKKKRRTGNDPSVYLVG
ncbi:hypothetical protein JTE90_009859 [Oedothorax gibbosus]|uniref:Uncharacterized protein n=1 Tax=Oedothorax gibbosus TaxID=931172 RepID=A0AAV6TEC7_9ARAC|nr:hypothetical protein JTE90_009859 [Oedothorax gibbosus]